ncbi:response regulator [Azospira inquinata]|uniref:Virulence sensor protein BvgS n=1 Tax=Azospira inquinata TaxID=2785627 RepID=A0A975SN31_9RHOO|nr:response regulator [Azospira inquinata]QWT45823.1 response regulator [Azospira inquinata]QWT48854.1 response regulator [Azospira inquinata]
MANPSRFQPLGQRLQAMLMVVALAALSIYASLTLIHGVHEVETLNRENLSALMDVTARNLEASLVFNDARAAVDTLRALSFDPGVLAVKVTDAAGHPFASYDRNGDQGRGGWELLPESWNRITLHQEIRFKNQVVGQVELLASRDRYWSSVARGGVIWALVTALALFAASLLGRRLQQGITGPIQRLERAARDIARSKRFSLRVEPEARERHDEISNLIDSFNAMLSEIENRDRTLSRYQQVLEAEVASRTAELVASRDAAHEASRIKSRFLANMSHEIRTPLNGMLGMLRLLQTQPLGKEAQRMSDIALQSGQTLLNLLNDILDLSKIEAGKLEMEHTPFDLGALADRNLLTLVENAQAKGLDLTVRLGAEVPALVMGDPNRLGQVLCNLLGNAVKFTEQGFVALEVERRPGGEGGKAEIRFLVKDSGIGISPAEQQRLFQAFTQADASTTRKFGGTGLGLAISRELVRLMGGELTLVSAPGEGSEFSFSLILPVVQEACRPGPSAYRRMLLVEPRVGTAEVVAEYGALAKVGCLRVVDGNMAAASLLRDEVDLVLVDTQAEPPKGRTWAELAAEAGQGKVWVSLGPLGDRDIQAPFQRHLSRPVSRQELLELLVASREEAPTPVVSRESPVRYSGRVLLVEDNPVNQEVTRGLLEYCGCAVVVVGDGQEALDTWEQGDFDLILMDCQMPVMDGYTAARSLRERERQSGRAPTAVIALTANSYPEDRQRCLAAGMNGFLCKPFSEEQLRALLDGWLAREEGGEGAPAPATLEGEGLGAGNAATPYLDSQVLQAIGSRQSRPWRDFLEAMVPLFLEQAHRHVTDVGSEENARIALHTLKSAAASVGAQRLAEAARILDERLNREGTLDYPEAARLLDGLLEETEHAMEGLLAAAREADPRRSADSSLGM